MCRLRRPDLILAQTNDRAKVRMSVGLHRISSMRTQGEIQILEQRARELRRQGLSILAIASQLHVGKGRIADWVRDIPGPPRGPRPGPQKPRIVSADGKRRRME